jgi:hypothetical protein
MSKPDTTNPQSGQGRPLPKKEADLFKNVVKFYESKQYKKGLKNAETILKRFPNHGETLCMKGLIVNSLGGGKKVGWMFKFVRIDVTGACVSFLSLR